MSLGPMEIVVVVILAVVAIKPENLPGTARRLGQALAEFRRWSDAARREMRQLVDVAVTDDRSDEG